MMDDQKNLRQPVAPTSKITKRKRSFAPVLTVYGNLQTITTMVGTTSQKDGASGQMNVRTQLP